jgi:hypothetical protein
MVVLLALGLAGSATGDEILFDDMSSPSYVNFSFNSADASANPDDLSFADYVSLGSGGNPGEQLQIDHFHEVDRDEFGDPFGGDGTVSLQSFYIEQSMLYNPLSEGAFNEISFSLDVNYQSQGSSTDFSMIFFLIEDATGGSASGFTFLTPGPNWQTITVPGLTNADFSSRDFGGALDLNFGFGFTSNGDVFGGDEVISLQVDNFKVNISNVPEPTSGMLFVVGGLAMLRIRKRRDAVALA